MSLADEGRGPERGTGTKELRVKKESRHQRCNSMARKTAKQACLIAGVKQNEP